MTKSEVGQYEQHPEWMKPVKRVRKKRCETCGKVSLHGYKDGADLLFCWNRMAIMHLNRTCRQWEPIIIDGIMVDDVWSATNLLDLLTS